MPRSPPDERTAQSARRLPREGRWLEALHVLTSPSEQPPAAHDAAVLSTSRAGRSRRYQPGDRRGHVESLFLKGNSPDGRRALWVKYTILAARGGRSTRGPSSGRSPSTGRAAAPGAKKQPFRGCARSFCDAPFRCVLPDGELSTAPRAASSAGAGPRLAGSCASPARSTCSARSPAHACTAGPFRAPRRLTPAPDSRLAGFFELDGERWDVDGFAAAQGHNWGTGHAHAYAWTHCNALHVPQPGSGARAVLAGSDLRTRAPGPAAHALAELRGDLIDGTLYRFDGVGRCSRAGSQWTRAATASSSRQGGARAGRAHPRGPAAESPASATRTPTGGSSPASTPSWPLRT